MGPKGPVATPGSVYWSRWPHARAAAHPSSGWCSFSQTSQHGQLAFAFTGFIISRLKEISCVVVCWFLSACLHSRLSLVGSYSMRSLTMPGCSECNKPQGIEGCSGVVSVCFKWVAVVHFIAVLYHICYGSGCLFGPEYVSAKLYQ